MLLITLDTTRADYLGCYGRDSARTPNIDRLAHEGTLFTKCTTCNPMTAPSHASIMTGLYPYVHGVRQNGTDRLAGANLTLAEALREAGYATQATVSSYVLNQRFGMIQGFDVYHDVMATATSDPMKSERKGDEIRQDALTMLRSLADQRFFLWVHFYDPHYPYESARVPDKVSPGAYEDEIAYMDTQIGRLLAELREQGLEDNTLVVVVCDHGEGLNEHKELFHGWFVYETSLHTALIFHCPGTIPAGQSIAAQVRTIDIAPTILELAGGAEWEHAQGVSLLPLLTGQQQDLNLTAYAETSDAHSNFGFSTLRSLTVNGWKYILAPKPELYDLDNDPAETNNLINERSELANDLHQRLRVLIAEAPPPPPKEDVAVVLDQAEIDRLQSLGYLGGGTGGNDNDEDSTELDRFEPRGADPKDGIELYLDATWGLTRLLDKHEYEAAEQLLRRLLQAMPDAASLYVKLGHLLYTLERPDEAVAAYQHAAAIAPDNLETQREYGRCLLRAGRYQDAADQLAFVLSNIPHDTNTLRMAARALSFLGQHERAGEHLRHAYELEPNNARILHDLGIYCAQGKQFAEAIEYFRKALAIDPNFAECQQDLQRVHMAIKQQP